MAGFIQLTGRANYQAFSNYIKDSRVMEGVDYVADKYPFTSGGWFWMKNQISNYINDEGASIEEVTRVVNGGYNGLEDRKNYFRKACLLFNI